MARTNPNPRVRFQTKDGVLVMDRELQYYEGDHNIVLMLARHDARARGVRIVDYKFEPTGLVATVEWLGK